MKKIIFTSFFCLIISIFLNIQAQTLQFSRVLLVTSSTIVPAGKTWKINGILPNSRLTTAYCSSSTSCGSSQTQHIIKINDTDIDWASTYAKGSSYGYSTTSIFTNQPIWLPEGTTLAASAGVYAISVTEFSIIP